MKYATGAAFRQALEDQIRRLNLEGGKTDQNQGFFWLKTGSHPLKL